MELDKFTSDHESIELGATTDKRMSRKQRVEDPRQKYVLALMGEFETMDPFPG